MMQFTFSGREVLRAKANRTIWNSFVNASVATVYMRSIDEEFERYLSTKRLLQN